MQEKNFKINQTIYEAGIGFLIAAAAAWAVCRAAGFSPLDHMYPCLLHTLTGFYCPGCGGTRAVIYFLQGRWISSFLYYPLVPAAFLWYAVFMVTYTIEKATGGKLSIGVRYHNNWLWLALAIVAANCAVKNITLAVAGIALIP